MQRSHILKAWGWILTGRHPVLSIELTKQCPLTCPGCYAFQPGHLGGPPLTSLTDFKGEALVQGVLELIARDRPLVVYLVGGEPLVRFRELSELLPRISEQNVEVRLVTSAVRPLPMEWAGLKGLGIVVSVDGLQPEHDERRRPATYARILKHIEGHRITVHCTINRSMMDRDDYLEEFMRFWTARPEVASVQVSFYTPQVGESSAETLTREMRDKAVAELGRLGKRFPKLLVNQWILGAFLDPPSAPEKCVFARVTQSVSADLTTPVEPCQLGGAPDCARCGCLASMALHGTAQYKLAGGVRVFSIFRASEAIGSVLRRLRRGTAEPGTRRPGGVGSVLPARRFTE